MFMVLVLYDFHLFDLCLVLIVEITVLETLLYVSHCHSFRIEIKAQQAKKALCQMIIEHFLSASMIY